MKPATIPLIEGTESTPTAAVTTAKKSEYSREELAEAYNFIFARGRKNGVDPTSRLFATTSAFGQAAAEIIILHNNKIEALKQQVVKGTSKLKETTGTVEYWNRRFNDLQMQILLMDEYVELIEAAAETDVGTKAHTLLQKLIEAKRKELALRRD